MHKMNLILLGITLMICGMIAIWFGAGHYENIDQVEHKAGDPIDNSKLMERLTLPEENTGMQLDPNSGHIKVMSSEEYKQFQKEWDQYHPKSKLHIKGSIGLMPLGWNPSEKLNVHTGNHYHFEDYKPNAFKPYSVSVKDEHNVILTTDNDTIVLYLENATNMAEEKLIYILPIKE